MARVKVAILALGIVAVVASVFSYYGQDSAVNVTIEGSSGTTNYKNAEVPKYPLSPPRLQVKAGTRVVWTNLDPITHHTVTSVSGLFDSELIRPNGRFSFKFQKAGQYQYYCTIHPWVSGEVVVAE